MFFHPCLLLRQLFGTTTLCPSRRHQKFLRALAKPSIVPGHLSEPASPRRENRHPPLCRFGRRTVHQSHYLRARPRCQDAFLSASDVSAFSVMERRHETYTMFRTRILSAKCVGALVLDNEKNLGYVPVTTRDVDAVRSES